jgi:hypothetical protein
MSNYKISFENNIKYFIMVKSTKIQENKKIIMDVCCRHEVDNLLSKISDCDICFNQLNWTYAYQSCNEFELIFRKQKDTFLFFEDEEICNLVELIKIAKTNFYGHNLLTRALNGFLKQTDQYDFVDYFMDHINFCQKIDEYMNEIIDIYYKKI